MEKTYARKTAALRGMASVLAIAFLGAASPAPAQESSQLRLSDISGKGAKLLTVEELRELLPGAKVTSQGGKAERRWENNADGKFVASGFDPSTTTPNMRNFNGQGTWHIGDNGTYCVQIEWKRKTEQWCRYLYKLGDKYYAANSAVDSAAPVHDIEFRK